MRKNKLTHLVEPSLRLYFLCLVVFAAVTAFFSVPAAVAEVAVVEVTTITNVMKKKTNMYHEKAEGGNNGKEQTIKG